MKVSNLYKSYGDKKVLYNFSHEFKDGITCIFGPSGCGKTTLLSIMAGTLAADSGVVDVPQNISMVWQEDRLLNWLSVVDNIMIPSDRKDYKYMQRLAQNMGIEPELKKRRLDLSGGQRQRVAIIRALICNYDLMLMDEPFKALDEKTKLDVMTEVKRELNGKKAVIITHDRADADFLDANVLIMG